MHCRKAFTLVELIVAVAVIAILSTIGLRGYLSFLEGVRDTNRIKNIAEIYEGLLVYGTDYSLPMPDDYIEIKVGDKLIGYQGNLSESILDKINFHGDGIDPKDKGYFTYMITKNKKSFALMGFLEESLRENNLSVFNNVHAEETERFPYMEGKKVGILLDDSNIPIQEIEEIKDAGFVDVSDITSDVLTLYLSNDEIYEGSTEELEIIAKNYNCKRIKDFNPSSVNGMYYIDPDSDQIEESIYCDMEHIGGGWNLLLKADGDNTTFNYTSSYWENSTTYNPTEVKYDETEYKSALFSTLGFKEVMLELRTDDVSEYIMLEQASKSLLDIFSGDYIATDFGRDAWKALIDNSSLQYNCDMEGWNVEPTYSWHNQIRIGIIGNNENNCDTPDSTIGIGVSRGSNTIYSVGNYANYGPDNGNKNTSSFGYLYVR